MTKRGKQLRVSLLEIWSILSYSVTVKNITVSVDDDVYRRARMIAAERDTSVSALVKEFLSGLANEDSDVERLKRAERALRERITRFRAADRLGRDELHRRGR